MTQKTGNIAQTARSIGFAIVLGFMAIMAFLAFVGTFCKSAQADEIIVLGERYERRVPQACDDGTVATAVVAAAKKYGTGRYVYEDFAEHGLCGPLEGSVIFDEVIEVFHDERAASDDGTITLVKFRLLRGDEGWDEFWGFLHNPVLEAGKDV